MNNQISFLLKWGNSICVFSLAFLFFYLYTRHFIYWDVFTTRDLLRAQGWLEGRFHWPGPEMNGGNNLPGPFFYFLLFPPFIFERDSIYSHSLLWYITWLSLTYTVVFSFAKRILKHKESLLVFLIIFITAVGFPLYAPLTFAWNPGFSIIFHVLALMGLYYWRETHKNLYLYSVGITIALGIQVHFLVSVHIITGLLFYFFGKQNKEKLLPILLFIFLASFPMLLHKTLEYFHVFEVSSGSQLGYIYDLIKFIFVKENWLRNVKSMTSFSLIPFFILFFITVWVKQKTGKWPFKSSTVSFFIMAAIPCLIGILLSGTKPRYLYFVPGFLMLFLSKWFDDLIPNNSTKRLNHLLAYVFIVLFLTKLLFEGKIHFLSFNNLSRILHVIDYHIIVLFSVLVFLLIIINVNLKWNYKNFIKAGILFVFFLSLGRGKLREKLWPYKPSVKESFSITRHKRHQHLYPVMEKIFSETHWLPEEAVKRIYTVGMHPQISLLAHYAMAGETVRRKTDLDKILKKPDGYIIIPHLKKFTDYLKEDWEQYLSRSSLVSDFLRQEIIDKKTLIQTSELHDLYWLISYKTTNDSAFTEGFSNMGQPYYWEEPEWLKNCHSTGQFQNRDGFYYCIVLPGHLRRAGVHIELSGSIRVNSSLTLSINFFGPLIGIQNGSMNEDGSDLWSDVQVNLLCGKNMFRHILPDMGNEKENSSMVTPLKFRISIDRFAGCRENTVREIALKFVRIRGSSYQKKVKVVWKNKEYF